MWLKVGKRRCESNVSFIERGNQKVLEWFGNMERLSKEKWIKRAYVVEVSVREER